MGLRVPGNRDEFPFSLPSRLYRVISPSCYCSVREDSVLQFGEKNYRHKLFKKHMKKTGVINGSKLYIRIKETIYNENIEVYGQYFGSFLIANSEWDFDWDVSVLNLEQWMHLRDT